MTELENFDVCAPLPTGTTLLEASAGTGKTWTIAALVAKHVASGQVRLDEMLVVTFTRAASQELRERVRRQLDEAVQLLGDPASRDPANRLHDWLLDAFEKHSPTEENDSVTIVIENATPATVIIDSIELRSA